MSGSRRWLAVLAVPALFSIACTAPAGADEEADSSDAAVSAATSEFDDLLREVATLSERCEREGKCENDAAASPTKTTTTKALHPLGGSGGATTATVPAKKEIREYTFCDALRPLAALESPYFFAGVSAKASAVTTLLDGGADLVFDLKHRQAAIFHYHNHGYANLVGAEVSAYGGWAFGDKANVLDAWSGAFETAEATVEVPFLKLAAGGMIFRSPDNSLWGAAAEVSVGLNMIPATLEVSASEGEWTPWDAATKTYGESLWLVGYDAKSARAASGKSHSLLQFRRVKDLALALVETFGIVGAAPAAQAAALAVLKEKGLTIERACPGTKK